MRFIFVGPMLDLLQLEIIPVVLIPHISNTFGFGDVCETKEWPKCIPNQNIRVSSEYGFRPAELFSAAKPGFVSCKKKNRNAKNMASAGARAYMGVWRHFTAEESKFVTLI